MKKCVVIFNGNLDSAVTLEIARSMGFEIYAISFDYGQLNSYELNFAGKYLKGHPVSEHKIAKIDLGWIKNSSIIRSDIRETSNNVVFSNVPMEYVPARNTLFLGFALAYAEAKGIKDIFVGVSEKDFGKFPDCRGAYFKAFEKMANLGTALGVQGDVIKIHTPILNLARSEIIEKGISLNVDFALTINCYSPTKLGIPCGKCSQCILRAEGFKKINLPDPLISDSLG